MDRIPLLRAGGQCSSRDTHRLDAVDGTPLAEVHEAPPLLVGRVAQDLRRAQSLPYAERLDVLHSAGHLFAAAVLGGEAPADYVRRHALSTGLPLSVARSALRAIPRRLDRLPDQLEAERPAGAAWPAGTDPARWVPRGRLLGVLAPSNSPLTHVAWLQALALGFAVALRPGSRDPFTPRRLVRALLAAGLPAETVAMLPGPHATGEALLQACDLGLVYGDEPTVSRYPGSSRYLVRGPGRTKALLCGPSAATGATYDHLVELIAADGGARCTNLSAVLVDGDAATVAAELARRLSELAAGPLLDEQRVLPLQRVEAAVALRRSLESNATAAHDVTRALGAPALVKVPPGVAALGPTVLLADSCTHPAVRMEMPFPSVCVAPWRPADGVAPLRDSLVVHVLGDGDGVLPTLLGERSVRTVVRGRAPHDLDGSVPHDGYLSAFLMEARGYLDASDVSGRARARSYPECFTDRAVHDGAPVWRAPTLTHRAVGRRGDHRAR